MYKFAQRNDDFRKMVFDEAAVKKKVPSVIIEKDFWVCWTLEKLFQDKTISSIILFKGGTSLSKVFNVIERFSEDIDLIIDWRLFTNDNPKANRSRTQQEKFNEKINKNTAQYLSKSFLPQIRNIISPVAAADIDNNDPHIINISYPSLFSDRYITPLIRLKAGPLASWVPNDEYSIQSYAAEYFPDLFNSPSCNVKAIKAERTFWEKATILHQEARRPVSKALPPRYSRHYYDMYRMAKSKIRESALTDTQLLKDVVKFKEKFYPCAWA